MFVFLVFNLFDMPLELIVFYLFSILAIASACIVVLAKNPIHSALFLILLFFCSTLVLLLFEVEFLALIFLVVYVGAVTVLFLFVVMMLDLKVDVSLRYSLLEKIMASLLAGAFFIKIFNLFFTNFTAAAEFSQLYKGLDVMYNALFLVKDIEAVILLLYGSYMLVFLIAGVILLIAIVGAIHLTLDENILRIRQQYKNQIYKNAASVVYLTDLEKNIKSLTQNE